MESINNYFNFDINCLVVNCEIKSNEYFNALVRTKFDLDTEISVQVKKWIHFFSEVTSTNWIVECGNVNPKRFLFKKKYICHHSEKNKSKSQSELTVRKRNLQCAASITILVKKITKGTIQNDLMLKDGFNGEIKVCQEL